jgi:hypothetical protein
MYRTIFRNIIINTIRIKLLLSILIILFIMLWYKEPIAYCEVMSTEYEDYVKEVLVNCLLDIVKDDIFIKRFGVTLNSDLNSNSFYLTQITEKFIKEFINSKESLAIILNQNLSKENMFEKLYELFYDYVEKAERNYIQNRLKILIPELPKILTYIVEYSYLYNFLNKKDSNVDNVITTEGFKYLYEKEQRKNLSNILLSSINVSLNIEGDNTKIIINIRCFIFEYTYIHNIRL